MSTVDDDQLDDGEDVVMQPRCVYCDTEHHAPRVMVISLGVAPCAGCGQIPPVFRSSHDYYAALRKVRASSAPRR